MEKRAFTSHEIAEAAIAIALAYVLSMVKIYHLPAGGSVTAGSMIPILFLALRRGYKLGLAAAVLYGVAQLIEGPYIVHPVQLVLDYPLAFGALGLAGFFASRVGTAISKKAINIAFSIVLLLMALSGLLWFQNPDAGTLGTVMMEINILIIVGAFYVLFVSLDIPYALLGVVVGIVGRFLCHFLSGAIFFSEYAPEGMSPWVYSALYNGSYLVPELIISGILIYLLVKAHVLELYR